MKLTDVVTSYEQVKEPVERTYESVTRSKIPDNIHIYVCGLKAYRLMMALCYCDSITTLIKDFRNTKREILEGLYIVDGENRKCYVGTPEFCDLKGRKKEIFLINNPAFFVIPSIFHGIGHVEYEQQRKNGYNKEMSEIAAYLYKDVMTSAISRLYPEFSGLYNFHNQILLGSNEIRVGGDFHKKCADYARKFHPKTSLRSLNEKMNFLLNCNFPEELEKELAKYISDNMEIPEWVIKKGNLPEWLVQHVNNLPEEKRREEIDFLIKYAGINDPFEHA